MKHSHLDQARRDEGECPACDLLWQAQRARTEAKPGRGRAEKEISDLVKREAALADQRYGNRARREQ